MELGVYIHFPWCRKLCPYCDFAVEVAGPAGPPHEAYRDAVLAELALRRVHFEGAGRARSATTIYFGGGTPSLWRPDCIAEVIRAVGGAPKEITIEANPTDITEENLSAWRAAGIGRISIGVQSLAPGALITLGRDHRFGDGRAAVERAMAAGFATSADFILGVPGAPAQVETLPAPHLSIYELTIEERTAFGQRVRDGRMTPLDEDALERQYIATHDALTARGYEHYEVSSYARPGQRAIHNSLYWRGAPYLGIGVGAASLEVAADGSGIRQTNPRRWSVYAAAPGVPADSERIAPTEMARDLAWLGMRTRDGVDEASLAPTGNLVEELVGQGLAERHAGRIVPTLRGFLMSDRIAARIVEKWL